MTEIKQGHPKGLYLLFATEMWERFSYYGMRAIFILFMTKALYMSAADASNVYGSYTGLVYLTPLLGGYISDRYWGNRRSILVGGLLMALGQFLMFFSGNIVTDGVQSASAVSMMWIGLTFLIIGNGFFKPNISTMVGQLYPKGDHRIDGAFTIFYMGINLGAFFSPLICGGLGDTGNIHDFRWGFLAAAIGMVISTISFELLKNKHLRSPEGEPVGMPKMKMDLKTYGVILGSIALIFGLLNYQKIIGMFAGSEALSDVNSFASKLASFDIIFYLFLAALLVMAIIIFTDKALNREEKQRVSVIFILILFVIFFWACFEQAGASLTLFADTQVKRDIAIFIPGYIILAAGLALEYFLVKALGWFFDWKNKLQIIIQVITGVALISLLVLGYIKDYSINEFPASWFQSINPLGIIILAPFFTMFWNALSKRNIEPSSPLKMAFGLLLVALGYVVIAFAVHGVDSQTKITMWWLWALYVIHTLGELCLSPIGLSMVAKLSPLKFSSLLMGTWFIANAIANKLAGILSALIPPGAGETPAVAGAPIPSFMGIEISNLFVFFCVFIALSSGAAVVLFGMYRWLEKRMHGVH
ncbi:MAG: peptide MFS transporter [Bacteroidetes bacterium]|nr:peptide MFS transporter [Bacteroidota bacterium]